MEGTQRRREPKSFNRAVVSWAFVSLGEEGQKGHWGQALYSAGVTLALCRSSLKLPNLLRPLMEKEGWETLPTVWGPITTGSMYAAGPVGDGSLRLGQAHHLLPGMPSSFVSSINFSLIIVRVQYKIKIYIPCSEKYATEGIKI